MPNTKEKGNGLGQNKVKSWNPASMRDDRTHSGQGNVPSHKRPGAGQKGSK